MITYVRWTVVKPTIIQIFSTACQKVNHLNFHRFCMIFTVEYIIIAHKIIAWPPEVDEWHFLKVKHLLSLTLCLKKNQNWLLLKSQAVICTQIVESAFTAFHWKSFLQYSPLYLISLIIPGPAVINCCMVCSDVF